MYDKINLRQTFARGVNIMINITDVKIRYVNTDNSKLKAIASIIIDDCIAIHDIKVLNGDNGIFIAMPSRKTPDGEFKDIAHPINTQARSALSKRIIEAYNQAVAE